MLDCTPETIIDCAAAAGFDGIGLRLSGDQPGLDLNAVRRHAAASGVRIHDVEVHRVAVESASADELIARAVAVGASALLVVSDLTDRTATVQAVRALRERCAASGLRLGLEYMAWTDPGTPMDAIEVARQTGCELVVDLLHHIRVGAGVDELDAIVAAGVFGWVQICDAPAARPTPTDLIHEARHGRLLPGQGALPLRPLLARLPAGIVVSVEVQSDDLLAVPPLERAQQLLDASRRVLG